MAKSPVPKGYNPVMPYLVVDDAAKAIEFYKRGLGAKERFRLTMGPKIGHAELDIGGSVIMLSDPFPEHGASPKALRGSTIALSMYVADADAAFAKAVRAGAKVERPVEDQFYGERSGRIVDPFGHRWSIQQHIEHVSPKEMQKRLDAMMAGMGSGSAPAKKKAKAAKK